ncbi:unnamed protein product [Paramecium octaurelia]|uniref:Uncharacterized protein n=1 Tax=Paramecium octaurelia TaxID=43137 RepID=A0A8S1SFZ7_PAROT|nr:unnamed protein product [Paramecium octaurelia]
MSGGLTYFKEDFPVYSDLVSTINDQLQSIDNLHVITCTTENKNNIAQYLRAKNATMAKYLIHLNMYLLHKLNYGNLDEFPVDQLIEDKILIQKIIQAQKKLQYSIDKLSKYQETQVNEDDQIVDQVEKLTLKPRIENLHKDETNDKINNPNQKYVPPKLAATLSKSDLNKQKQERREELKKTQQKAKLIKSILDDQETDKPKEMTERDLQQLYYGRAEDEKQIEKRKYEEDHMTRLPTTRDEKRRERIAERKANVTRLDDFQEFETINKVLNKGTKKIKKPQGSKLKGSMKKIVKRKRR